MKVWAYLFNSCIYESADAVQSLHMTKEGAEKAMQESKQADYLRWKEDMLYFSDPDNDMEDFVEDEYKECPYQIHSVKEMEIYE